jgi:hypothetical protein
MPPSLRLPVTVAAASNSSAPAVLAHRPSPAPSNQAHPDLAMHAVSMPSLGPASVAATAAAAAALTQLPLPQNSAVSGVRTMPTASVPAASSAFESASAALASPSVPAAVAAQAAAATAFAAAAVQPITAHGAAVALSSAPRRLPPGPVPGDSLHTAARRVNPC